MRDDRVWDVVFDSNPDGVQDQAIRECAGACILHCTIL